MLMAFWQVQRLTREINHLEQQAVLKHTRLMQYQRYAERLGSSTNLMAPNIAGLPSELIPRATAFSMYSNQASMASAMNTMQMQKMMGNMPILNDPQSQQMLEMSAFNRFREESLKILKQQEVAAMHEIETEIQQEITSIETRIKEKKAILESSKQLLENDIKENVPRFGLS